MNSIFAGQHIYGNVEKEDSPSNIGGFQTLYYSKDLISESEVDEIERRLGYYPSEDTPEKLVFFKMGEKYVTTRIIPLEDVDKFGRKGAYIAHSFVFSKNDFEKFNNNPFVVFDLFQDKFVKALPQALAKGKKGNLNIASEEFSIDTDRIRKFENEIIDSITGWKKEDIRKLVSLAFNESKLKNESLSFILSGTQTEIRKTLKGIFSLIPDKIRSACSFDTYFLGCNPVATKYWSYCYPKAPHISPQLILANTDTLTVSNINVDSSSPYEKWIFSGKYPHDVSEKHVFRNAALELDRYLINQESNKEKFLEFIDSSNLEQFLETNQSLFQEKLLTYFKEQLPEQLAKYVWEAVTTEYKSESNAVRLQKMITGFNSDEISTYLFDKLKVVKSPKKQEINDLKSFLEKNKHKLLEIIYLIWSENFEALPKKLKILSDEEYQIALELLFEKVEMNTLIVDSKISQFTDFYISKAVTKKELKENLLPLVKVYVHLNQEPLLSKFVPIIPHLKKKQLMFIQEYFDELNEEKRKKIPADFNKVILESIKTSKEKGGLLSNLKKRLF